MYLPTHYYCKLTKEGIVLYIFLHHLLILTLIEVFWAMVKQSIKPTGIENLTSSKILITDTETPVCHL